jgi:RNA-directed DNA polymerase
MMSSAAVPVKNIPGIVKAIPGSGENRSPSRRNRCSPSARNPVRLHPGMLFTFTPESFSPSPGIRKELKLKVNEAKSAVARPQERKFLGFSFTAGPEVKRMIAPKALDRFKQRIREITIRAKGVSMKTTMEELAPYMRGWRSYFGFCETSEVLIGLTRWVRLRLRAAMWRQWKTQRRRRAALLELGVREPLASNTAGSGRGPWYLAKAKALSVGLSNAYFKSLGLPSLFEEMPT